VPNNIVIVLFYVLVGTSLFFGLINLIRSNVYDVRQSKLRRERAKHPHMRRLRQRPLTSVVVYANNDHRYISGCLEALVNSSYKKLEIIVADNASSDGTAKLVRQLIKKYPKLKIRLVAKKVRSSRSNAIGQAAKYAKGSLIAVIGANCTLDKQALKNSTLHLFHTDAEAVLLNTRTRHDYTIMGLADSLKSIMLGRAKKAGTLIIPGLDANNYAAVYTRDAFSKVAASGGKGLGNINSLRRLNLRLAYESLAIASIHGLQTSFSPTHVASAYKSVAAIHIFRNILSICEPFLVAFMVYVALEFSNPGYVALAWLCFTFLFALAIWADETKSPASKLWLTILGLAAYSLYLLRQLSGYLNFLVRPVYR
jgi:hypothetical protein